MRISDWSSDVCSSDLAIDGVRKLCGHLAHTINGITLLIGGKQQRHRARMRGMGGNELFQRDHKRRNAAFHVGGTAAVQHAVTYHRRERKIGRASGREGVCKYG